VDRYDTQRPSLHGRRATQLAAKSYKIFVRHLTCNYSKTKAKLYFAAATLKRQRTTTYYDTGGDYIGKIYPTGPTQTLVVYTDGTEMYKPATREVLYLINQPASSYIKDERERSTKRV
jgi:hypothetical protein